MRQIGGRPARVGGDRRCLCEILGMGAWMRGLAWYPRRAMPTKKELLSRPIEHLDIKQHNVAPLVDAMAHMAFSSRDTHRAASIYDMMLRDTECGVILCIAGSIDR